MPGDKRLAPQLASSRRRSGRLSSTPKRSAYFAPEVDDNEPNPKKRRGRLPRRQSQTKEESDEQYEEDSSEGDVGQETEEDDEDEPTPKKRRGGRPKRQSLTKNVSDEQYDEEGSEQDAGGEDEGDGEDALLKVEIIPLEKLRDGGGIAYEDHRLHRNTLLFLQDLKSNNKQPWLRAHDGEYRRALKDWQSFVEAATQMVMEIDETIPELPVKDVIFRIHRDIRFSKDPTPYKPHFSAAWSRTGRKGPYACYYIHCEPGSSFVGGGLWHPEAQLVARLRRSIDRHPARWRRTLNEPLLKKRFFPDLKAKAGPEAAVKAFVGRNQENALKRRPMAYEVTHRDIDLLKLRNYTLGAKIDAEVLCQDDALQQVGEIIHALFGFVSFLNSIAMPDPNGDDEDQSSDGDDEDED